MAPFDPDADQRVVLEHTAGPMLVAGPFGTGKTAVTRERFARMIEDGADPERVALAVGSRRARDEAREALLTRLSIALPSLHVVTTHGLAYHVIGQRFGELGYQAPPRVLSAADQFRRVRELLSGEDQRAWPAYNGLLHLRGFADQVRQFVLRAQESLVQPEDIEHAGSGWGELGAFYRRYLSVLDSVGEVDFAGLLQQAAVAAAMGEPVFDHVIVDDHQDSTLAAERLLAEIRPTSLVVAGNLDAHVFSFQGFTDESLRRFGERNPGTVAVELRTEHRPRAVVEAWRAGHVSEEYAAVARELRRIHVEVGVPWGQLAVVVRRHGPEVAGIHRALDDAHVPRTTTEAGSPGTVPATEPFVRALEWLVASDDRRDGLIEPLLTSEVGRLSPASARTLLRLVRAHGHRPGAALEHRELFPEAEEALAAVHDVLERAGAVRASALDAFKVLWSELPYARELVERAERDHHARVDLDAVVQLARTLEGEGREGDPSVEAFLQSLGPAEGGPELAAGGDRGDAVHVLTAHAAVGRELDTVIVLDVLEGHFPSLSRPEPMFDLGAIGGARPRAEVNRARLAEERRLFTMVLRRARRRVLLTATDPAGDAGVTLASRFVEELGVEWRPAPVAAGAEPVSVAEASATWRRSLADAAAALPERLAALDGLLRLGEDPATWWFQQDWTDLGAPERDQLHLSYSRLSTLENCELQFVLSSELGLDPAGGYQAWVGKLVHQLIEECELGLVERTPEAFRCAIDERWQPQRFPSHAISEAERANVKDVMVPNWFSRYADPQATATERSFAFPFEGAVIRGKIDRIGPGPSGGTRITDYKSGRSDDAGKPGESLQLGIYYLAVNECADLEGHRPVEAIELAFLSGNRRDGALDVQEWQITHDRDETYQADMRERVSALIARIRELDRARSYSASTKASCFFCSFQTLCARYPQGGELFPVARPAAEEPS